MASVTFNPVTRIITITEVPVLVNGEYVIDLNIKRDIYSFGKEEWQATESLRRLKFPIRAVGGDTRPSGNPLGSTFFLAPDWKVAPYESNHRLRVSGNFYAEDGTSVFRKTVGAYNVFVEQDISAIVETSSAGLNPLDKQQIIDGVWEKDISGILTDGQAGYELQIARLKAALAAALNA